MANYYGTARSNYFHVEDNEHFIEECRKRGIGVWDDRDDDRVGIYADTGDGGGWPSSFYDEETEDYVEFEVVEFVAEHLEVGEVAILMEAGAEKMRYVHGHAIAVNHKGETRRVILNDIYDLARELTDEPDEITQCDH